MKTALLSRKVPLDIDILFQTKPICDNHRLQDIPPCIHVVCVSIFGAGLAFYVGPSVDARRVDP